MITCAEEIAALDDVAIIYGRHLQISMPYIMAARLNATVSPTDCFPENTT